MASNNYYSREVDGVSIFLAGVLVFRILQRYTHHISINKLSGLFYLIIGVIALVLLLICVTVMLGKRRRIRDKELKPKLWSKMNGRQFENQIVIWLKQHGYSAVTKTEYFDKGIDILALKDSLSCGIQVKRSKNQVGVAAVRAAVAGLKSYGCDKAIVITNSVFTHQARGLARDNDCLLIDGKELRSTLKGQL